MRATEAAPNLNHGNNTLVRSKFAKHEISRYGLTKGSLKDRYGCTYDEEWDVLMYDTELWDLLCVVEDVLIANGIF